MAIIKSLSVNLRFNRLKTLNNNLDQCYLIKFTTHNIINFRYYVGVSTVFVSVSVYVRLRLYLSLHVESIPYTIIWVFFALPD